MHKFSENLARFVFFLPPFWDSLFCLITNEFLFFFLNLWKRHVWCLRYSIFYISNYFVNFESCDVMINISKRERMHFLIYLLNRKSFGQELGQIIDIVMGIVFGNNLHDLEHPDPLWVTKLLQLTKNQAQLVCGFLLFWRCALKQSKIVKEIYQNLFHQNHKRAWN